MGTATAESVKVVSVQTDGLLMIKRLRKDEHRSIRISDADRNVAAERLREAVDEGRISLVEFETRLDSVYSAIYAADLREPMAELPGGDAVASLEGVEPSVLRVGAAGLKRSGDWHVPARIRVTGGMGSVALDFCNAEMKHSIVRIELKLGTGSIKLVVPDRATANVDEVVANMGAVTSKVAPKPKDGATHFVVSGHTRMGSVEVRQRRRIAGVRF